MFYYAWGALFGLTAIGFATDRFSRRAGGGQIEESLSDSSFAAFQGGFLAVYFLALFGGEWVQGPYEKAILLRQVRTSDANGIRMEPEAKVRERACCMKNLSYRVDMHIEINL